MCKHPSVFGFSSAVLSQWVLRVNFHFFDTNFCFNPKSKHYVTLATPRVVPVRRAKAFILRNVVPLATVTLPAEVRQLVHPSSLAARDGFTILM